MRTLLLLAVRGYQRFLSPFLPASCRFVPSCSEYAHQAIVQHGAVSGLWLAVVRLVKCAPWHPGGYDPVPPAKPRAVSLPE